MGRKNVWERCSQALQVKKNSGQSPCISLSLSVPLSLCICFSVTLSLSLCLSLSVCLSICLYVVCLSVILSVCCLYVCLSLPCRAYELGHSVSSFVIWIFTDKPLALERSSAHKA